MGRQAGEQSRSIQLESEFGNRCASLRSFNRSKHVSSQHQRQDHAVSFSLPVDLWDYINRFLN